jgi:hypothetical protein
MSCESQPAAELRELLQRRPDAVETIQQFIAELRAAEEGENDETLPETTQRTGWRPRRF